MYILSPLRCGSYNSSLKLTHCRYLSHPPLQSNKLPRRINLLCLKYFRKRLVNCVVKRIFNTIILCSLLLYSFLIKFVSVPVCIWPFFYTKSALIHWSCACTSLVACCLLRAASILVILFYTHTYKPTYSTHAHTQSPWTEWWCHTIRYRGAIQHTCTHVITMNWVMMPYHSAIEGTLAIMVIM